MALLGAGLVWSAFCWPVTATQESASENVTAIELGAPFADGAVLQREMPVPVWGWSTPGARVTVEFAGQKKSATAGTRGKWMLELDELEACAEPAEMVIGDDRGHTVILRNILVGEVWMASGQSNMQWKVGKSNCNRLKVETKGKAAPIREFEVTSVYAMLHPIEKAAGAWKSGGYGEYSAIAFAFAHRLHEELNVPIGILNCSFSQTAIQAWVPREGFRDGKDEYTQAIYRKILETDPTTPEHKAAWSRFYRDIETTLEENAELVRKGLPARAVPTRTPGNMSGNRDASWLFNGRLNPVVPYAIRGAIWNQGYANMGEGLPYYNNLRSLVRGWRMRWKRPALPVYFHQFYCPGQKGGWKDNTPDIGPTAEMRLGTWLATDIPGTGMASQIDITGSIHYRHKAVPGQRLALHALKNQYGKKVVADGPMFRSYTVRGDELLVEFEHAEGGLVVAEAGSNALSKDGTGFADPKIIEKGDDQVKLFYLADEDRVWHRARMRIDGKKVIVTSPEVKSPRGVSYATRGVAFQPGLYNRALLPATPFIYFDQEMVTSRTWPDEALKIAGVVPDPATVGKRYEYRKMPLLSAQFRDGAVLQAGQPITFWGSAIHNWGYEAEGEAVIRFSFDGIEKTIEVRPGMGEWQVTVPAMKASAEPRTLRVTFQIDGELVHERVCENIVIGDVWYVAASAGQDVAEEADGMVRVFKRKAKRTMSPRPSRYSVCVSTTPKNRFASEWKTPRAGFCEALGKRIQARTGKPVGIVYMNGEGLELKHWIGFRHLEQAPSLLADYEDLAAVNPGNPHYDANVRRYIAEWKKYWGEYVPRMMATRQVPDGAAWGSYPSLASSVSTTASQAYNVMVYPFASCRLKGLVFLCSETMCGEDQGADYGAELSVLASCWKEHFGGEDPHFFYTNPRKELAPRITEPRKIKGKSKSFEVSEWGMTSAQMTELIERIVEEAYGQAL